MESAAELLKLLSPADRASLRDRLKLLDELPDHVRAVASIPGPRRCFICTKVFLSPDAIRVRICLDCRQKHTEPNREVSLRSMGLEGYDFGE